MQEASNGQAWVECAREIKAPKLGSDQEERGLVPGCLGQLS